MDSSFDLVSVLASLAGLAMVGGGIWTLVQASATLKRTPPEQVIKEAFELSVRKHQILPGAAMLGAGLVVIALFAWLVRPAAVRPINVTGQIAGADTVTVHITAEWPVTVNGGTVFGRVLPSLDQGVWIEVTGPGVSAQKLLVDVNDIRSGTVDLGTLEVTRMQFGQGQIDALPEEFGSFDFGAPPAPTPEAFGEVGNHD